MKIQHSRLAHILHHHLNNGDLTPALRSVRATLIAVAVGIWIVFALCIGLAWGLRG